ncbi:hypothetical protein GCM10009555_017860 [Acrocarpospora macrocephala]|uniref:Uncharacterized protein n=1 Tax=Acrocarpospora macrocephala TaxID=150177 RepID=A0A5M3WF65_9ACTN|nr:hypothetical protein [Acrocarpospora macrocephala]GES07446.1 hypothetical protein Amac_010410 [Acrocarpospora macrocephala]
MSRAATLDQPGLWDLPEQEPKPAPTVSKSDIVRPRRRHLLGFERLKRDKAWNAEPCAPACLVCGKAEGRGLCHAPNRCAVVCVHTRQPARAEVCIITARVTAELVYGVRSVIYPAPRLAVITCPECGKRHWHGATPGVHIRTGPCGACYVVHLARPKITAAGEER